MLSTVLMIQQDGVSMSWKAHSVELHTRDRIQMADLEQALDFVFPAFVVREEFLLGANLQGLALMDRPRLFWPRDSRGDIDHCVMRDGVSNKNLDAK